MHLLETGLDPACVMGVERMRVLWRALPDLALPLALGLALAYLGTGFVPRPAPALRPPEDLRARGLGYAEESPVRAILERNVLALETTVFDPQGVPPRAEQAPAPSVAPSAAPAVSTSPAPQGQAAIPAPQRAPQAVQAVPQAGFAPLDPALKIPGATQASAPLSGGPAVQGPIAAPGTAEAAAPAQPQIPAQALPEKAQRAPAPTPVPSSAPTSAPTSAPASAPAAQPAQPAQPATPAAPPLTGIRLVGVIAGGGKPLAMLSVDGQALSLEPGGVVRGWTLERVEPGRIVLRSGPHQRMLTLQGPVPPQGRAQ